MSPITEPGVPAHRKGHVPDIVFSNIPVAIGEVADAMHTGADHAALQLTVPANRTPKPDQFRLSVNDDDLETFADMVEDSAHFPPDPRDEPTR
ncbi:hypothetical protein DL768_011016 [Monosporascus sp. mg162]|nr:hypothetical protein DL768_011016 [Monosporascus sp. mg162]